MTAAAGLGLRGYVPIVAAVSMWAFQVPAMHDLGMRWDTPSLTLSRYIIAALAFWAILRLAPQTTGAASVGGDSRKTVSLRARLGLGALMSGFAILFTLGIVIGDPLLTVTATAVMPLTASLVSWAMSGQPPDRALLAALALVVPGAALAMPGVDALLTGETAGTGAEVDILRVLAGLTLVLVGQATWSLYSLAVGRWMPHATQFERTRVSIVWSLPYHTLLFAVAWPAGLIAWDVESQPAADAALIVLAALGPLVLGVLLWNLSVARLGLPICALFLNLIPVLGAGIAAAFGTVPTALQLAGIAMVMVGMGAAQYRRRTTTAGRSTLPRS
ncbi:MAG: EamA family transporter [Pseudomonadota bacterium]